MNRKEKSKQVFIYDMKGYFHIFIQNIRSEPR